MDSRSDHLLPKVADRLELAKSWLPRYTGMPLDKFGDYVLLTNFSNYVSDFCNRFRLDFYGAGKPMQAATNSNGVTLINFGIGSPNAATIMDLSDQIQEVSFEPVSVRLARLLVELADREGSPRGNQVVLRHRYSHQELARRLGTSRETVTRMLKRFRGMGLVALEGRVLVVLDRQGLEGVVDRLADNAADVVGLEHAGLDLHGMVVIEGAVGGGRRGGL